MNERIAKLYDQAIVIEDGGDYVCGELDPIKFAELIVLECMEVFSKDLPEPGDGKMLEVINRVCAVAEHFGVEK